MGISAARHQAHVVEWLGKFSNYKRKWLKHLFHHANIDAAIDILKSGELLSRKDAVARNALRIDIAPDDIIQHRNDAHEYVRLYFRPKTPTQYHIEGIRKEADFYRGKHAGFLVMLAFNRESVLTLGDTRFSNRNMQSHLSEILDGDTGFEKLDFRGIYHDEAYPSDEEKSQRCAEVLASSPLNLASTLRAIVVRTDADVATIKYRLMQEGLEKFIPLVRRSQDNAVFLHEYAAVQFVDAAPGRIKFKLRETRYPGDIQTSITVIDDFSGHSVELVSQALRPNQDYFTKHNLPEGDYRIMIELEGCYAHESVLKLTQ
ncbi:DUF4433 domain-containing protein [Ruegeria sp. 2012CJ41-6]|uniref:DUF4433 domain-containing protein n=1 Tax=Ruegeria spongiae TaxID=2942209 RepID=A0ABT0Q168_9RHOB|nr:DarT ssDNA thymidine ADP-ribosyltransferase family protein [Ruegeria spongiae]MCL6283631.1 DUF4433 domain-containing protein [Ruegeria spongiae]